MQVALKLFATLGKLLPAAAQHPNGLELELAPGTTVQELIAAQRIPPDLCALVLVNGVYIAPSERAAWALAQGDTVAIWPPVGGG